jgi:HNH endonuclease
MSRTRPADERFWAKVDASGDCWEWTAARMKNGYGVFNVGGTAGTALAHRFAYALLVGCVDAALQLDHLCRNRTCVNPDHLEPVSQRTNLMRGGSLSAINRRKTHCHRGHSLADAYVYPAHRAGLVQRICRACTHDRYINKREAR